MILKVSKIGHPVLRKKAKPVPKDMIESLEVQDLIDDMIDTMRDYEGVGIAAPQVHVSYQIFCVECVHSPRYQGTPKISLYTVINPKYRSTLEACWYLLPPI